MNLFEASSVIAVVLFLLSLLILRKSRIGNLGEIVLYTTIIYEVIYILSTLSVLLVRLVVLNNYETFGSIESWIGFLGSMAGGAITLIGVVITIFFQKKINNKNKEEQLENQRSYNRRLYKPIFSLDKNSITVMPKGEKNEDSSLLFYLKNIDDLNDYLIFSIDMDNRGRGEAEDIFFELEKYTKASGDKMVDVYNSDMLGKFDFMMPGDRSTFFIHINKKDILNDPTFYVYFNLYYKDYDHTTYKQTIGMDILLKTGSDEGSGFYDYRCGIRNMIPTIIKDQVFSEIEKKWFSQKEIG